MNSTRPPFAALFVICAGLLAIALYLQEEVGLEPCPMCILQRYAFFAIGFAALAAAVHNPRGTALKVYAGLVTLFAIAGSGVAIRHSDLQHFPPERETCGTDLEFLLNTFSLSEAFPKIFAGTGSCSKVDWKMLGLSLPEWALVWFILIVIGSAWLAFRRRAAR